MLVSRTLGAAPLLRLAVGILLTATLTATPSLARAQAPADTVPVVLTVSGGISLGSYQSGVNWALLQFFKRATFDTAYRRWYERNHQLQIGRDSVEPAKLPYFNVSSVAGASAGNINGILSALEWCRIDWGVPPERSSFWRTWITTGWEQLFPADTHGVWYRRRSGNRGEVVRQTTEQALQGATQRSSRRPKLSAAVDDDDDDVVDRGIFLRTYYRTKHFPDLDDQIDERVHRGSCDVPVGITVTRLQPAPYPIEGGLSPLVQREAGIVQVRANTSESASDGRYAAGFFQPAKEVRRDEKIGAMIVLPSVTHEIPSVRVYRLVEASSAFPVAFGPRRLRYYPAQKVGDDGSCPLVSTRVFTSVCARVDTAFFVDGGVFDNNPIDLALRLDGWQRPNSRRPATILYVDPDAVRDAAGGKHLAIATSVKAAGFGAVAQLLRGAIPSARQYELFAFARARAGISPELRQPIQITDRFHPVTGAYLSAFAAFLGRPFREYDFFVGVYDAAYFIARRHLCVSPWKSDSVTQGAPDTEARACVRRHMMEISEGKHFEIGPVAPSVLRALIALEFGPTTPDRLGEPAPGPNATRNDTLRVQVLHSLVQAMAPLQGGQEVVCKRRDIAENLLCQGGFDAMLRRFATPPVKATLAKWSASEACGDSARLIAPDDCYADSSFVRLVSRPYVFANAVLGRVLRRAWEVEKSARDETAEQTGYERMVELIEFWYRSSTERYRTGFEVDPSTIPAYVTGFGPRLLTVLPPYQASFSLWGRAYLMSYRPTLYLGGKTRTAITLPLEYVRLRRHDEEGNHQHAERYTFGAGLAFQVPQFFLSGVQVHGFGSGKFDELVRFDADHLGADLSLLLLGGKVKLGVRQMPKVDHGEQWYEKTALHVGLSDLNGLVYWWMRQRN